MSLIERAAQRLEELRKAGVEIPPGRSVGTETRTAGTGRVKPAAPAPSTNSSGATRQATDPAGTSQNSQTTRRHLNLDLARLANAGFVTPDMPRSRIADEFRIIKRPLLMNAVERRPRGNKNANLIMVTSAVPGEGKTFSAVNLAMSIASELDKTVLLVDADVARPSLPHLLGVPTGPGLLDVLEDRGMELTDVLIRTNVDKLTLLSGGNPHAQATELLASDAMSGLLDEISARYSDRIVIFDSPPLLVTTEARVLATHMGQVVVVVHAEQTLQTDVKKALATIESCPIKMLVLNQAQTTAQGAYGYGYGYGYGI